MKINFSPQKNKIERTLSHSVKEGCFWAIMNGFGEYYLPLFALFLGASPFQISMITSFPQLIGSFIQLFATRFLHFFKSRKRFVSVFSLFNALIWLAIIFFSWKYQNVWILVILASIFHLTVQAVGPAWMSWMGDLIPPSKRGFYFGRRNRILGAVSFTSIVLAGWILAYFEQFDTLTGFLVLFFIAFVGRFISFLYLTNQYEPKVELRELEQSSFLTFLKRLHHTNFGIFSIYIMLMHFVLFLVSPIFVVYWVDILGFSYLQYSSLISVGVVSGFLTFTYWGQNADNYGNKTILWASTYLIALIYALWIVFYFIGAPFYIALILQGFAGMAWSGFILSANNFLYDTLESSERVRMISYHNVLKGGFLFAGGAIGGLFVQYYQRGFLVLLALSCMGVILINISYLLKIQEVRLVQHKPRFLHFVTAMPAQGIMVDSMVGMNRTVKEFRDQLRKVERGIDYWEKRLKK